jgi:hypothetical protein
MDRHPQRVESGWNFDNFVKSIAPISKSLTNEVDSFHHRFFLDSMLHLHIVIHGIIQEYKMKYIIKYVPHTYTKPISQEEAPKYELENSIHYTWFLKYHLG